MQFNSHIFILLFMPLTIAAYFLFNKLGVLYGKILLIVASVVFYSLAGTGALAYLIASILVNYVLIRFIRKSKAHKKAWFIFAVTLNAASLVFFKYYGFCTENIPLIASSNSSFKELIVPLGISFYTFSAIAYLAAVYDGTLSDTGFLNYALYMLYFPKLTMGPITEPSDIIPQFDDVKRKKADSDNLSSGIKLFSLGLIKKALFADTFAAAVTAGFSNVQALNSMETLITMLSYTFEIYFDFSGYSDMATGISLMLNIDLPINFDSPYKATSIRDFWKRWHISLTSFLTKHIYIPLGGSRRGKVMTLVNTMIVFLISGMWHGANWTFWLWGCFHGLLMCAERVFEKAFKKLSDVVRWFYTFISVNVLWLLFRASSIGQWKELLKRILFFQDTKAGEFMLDAFDMTESSILQNVPGIGYLASNMRGFYAFAFFTAAFLICLIPENNYRNKGKRTLFGAIICALLLVWGILCLSGESTFVYFGF